MRDQLSLDHLYFYQDVLAGKAVMKFKQSTVLDKTEGRRYCSLYCSPPNCVTFLKPTFIFCVEGFEACSIHFINIYIPPS